MSDKGYLSSKGSCASCNHVKRLPYTKAQLDAEGSGIKSFFKGVYNKVIKPLGKEAAWKKFLKPELNIASP